MKNNSIRRCGYWARFEDVGADADKDLYSFAQGSSYQWSVARIICNGDSHLILLVGQLHNRILNRITKFLIILVAKCENKGF
jgi:hypothetical protein